jgi:hypothetical protein
MGIFLEIFIKYNPNQFFLSKTSKIYFEQKYKVSIFIRLPFKINLKIYNSFINKTKKWAAAQAKKGKT